MIIHLGATHSLVSNWVGELRNIHVQGDRMRFRRNLERIGEVIGYEISKQLTSVKQTVTTPLGDAIVDTLADQPVLATILRAGLPMHQGLMNYFDKADNAFLSAYRKHHPDGSFEICLEYMSCPDLSNRVLILCDPMLATGASLIQSVEHLKQAGHYSSLHIVCAIASQKGVDDVQAALPDATIWCAAIDAEMNSKNYIVPGLGDAGDLAFGTKMQQ